MGQSPFSLSIFVADGDPDGLRMVDALQNRRLCLGFLSDLAGLPIQFFSSCA